MIGPRASASPWLLPALGALLRTLLWLGCAPLPGHMTGDEPRELFTLQVENGNDPGSEPVPLLVREGDNAEVLASLFASRYGLDATTRDELALAIIEHSKTMGFVRPLFVLEANVSNSTVPLNVYKGDAPRGTAKLFAQRYNLSEEAQSLIERVIAKKAKEDGHLHPLLSLAVTIAPDEQAELNVYEGDIVADVVSTFAAKYGLSDLALVRLQRALLQQLKKNKLAEPLLELTVDLGPDKGMVPLALYDGEVLEHVATEFAEENGLSLDEAEGVVVMLEEQLTKRGLLPPLLFKLPVVLKSGRVVQLPVHDGDEAAELAAAFVQRYAGEIWPAMDSTRSELEETIATNIATYHDSVVSSGPLDTSAPSAGSLPVTSRAPDVVGDSKAAASARAAAAAAQAALAAMGESGSA